MISLLKHNHIRRQAFVLAEMASGSGQSSASLTEEQRRRMEENRKKALEKLQSRQITSSPRLVQGTAGQSTLRIHHESCSTVYSQHSGAQSYGKSPFQRNLFTTDHATNSQSCESKKKLMTTGACLTDGVPKPKEDLKSPWYARFSYKTESPSNKNTQAISFGTNKFGRNADPTISPTKLIKASFVLQNTKRFEVQCPYNVDVIGVFKTIPSRTYNAQSKTWNFSLTDHDQLVSALKGLQIGVKVDGIPSKVMAILKELNEKPKQTLEDIDLSNVDDKLLGILMPFQREGIQFGIHHRGRVLIADDMGLGKTFQAIGIACYYRAEWPVLVFSPSSVRMNWAEAFQNWAQGVDSSDINVVQTGKDDSICGTINIISYDLIPKHLDRLMKKNFKVIIADESHFIKNSKAARTKAAIQLLKAASRVILLSGTPALSRPEELFTQISAVDSKLFRSFHHFGLRYCDAKQNAFGWDYSGSSNLEELKIILKNKIMIRRLKNDVLHQLPEKQRQLVFLNPSLINTKSIEKEAKKVTETKKGSRDQRSALLEYYCASCEAKIKSVLEYVTDKLENQTKFILFAHHQMMLNAICDLLTRKKIGFMRIDGKNSSIERQESVRKFTDDPKCLVAVLSILAANMGLNLNVATTVIFAELYWNPGALVQAEDRVYRIGQKNAVTIIYLLAKKTSDDYIWPLIQEKLAVLTNTGLGQDECLQAEVSTFRFLARRMKSSNTDGTVRSSTSTLLHGHG